MKARGPIGRIAACLSFALALGSISPQGANAAEAMSFRIATLGPTKTPLIVADGEITNETAADFQRFVLGDGIRFHVRRTVVLQSPGGSVVGAMQLGTMFRRIGAAVIVASAHDNGFGNDPVISQGACLAGCTYALLGGVKRVIPMQSRVGVKRMLYDGPVRDVSGVIVNARRYASGEILSQLKYYVRSMGIDPRFVDFSENTAPDGLRILTAQDINHWRIGSISFPGKGPAKIQKIRFLVDSRCNCSLLSIM